MAKENLIVNETSDRELVLSRLIQAPRELVFKAWTDPRHVVEWWGPDGFTTTIQEMDVRPGGVWRFIMHGPDGRNYKNKVVYVEVKKPERIVYQHRDDGEAEPVNFHVTVTFEKQGHMTRLTMKMLFETAAEFERVSREYGAVEGAQQMFVRLRNYVESL